MVELSYDEMDLHLEEINPQVRKYREMREAERLEREKVKNKKKTFWDYVETDRPKIC